MKVVYVKKLKRSYVERDALKQFDMTLPSLYLCPVPVALLSREREMKALRESPSLFSHGSP